MRISKEKRDRIKENILSLLFQNSPKSFFTAGIASEITRDEEFTKQLLLELQKNEFVSLVEKSLRGVKYNKRQRWRISSRVYDTYKKLQEKGIETY